VRNGLSVVGDGSVVVWEPVVGSAGVVAGWLARDWAALRAVRSAAAVSLWRAVEMADQRVAAARAVRRSTAAKTV
jgi:hypothetical protein